MNSVIMTGRLTRDPEVRWSGGDFAVARFSLAVDRERKNKDGERVTDFPNCVAFGKTAEFVERNLAKGDKIAVVGRMESSKYEKNGESRVSWEVPCDRIEILQKKEQMPERSGVTEFDEGGFVF